MRWFRGFAVLLCGISLAAGALLTSALWPKSPTFVDVKQTEWPDLNTAQLGEKYPHLLIEGVPVDYDPAQKWYVTHNDANGWDLKQRRVMWMGGKLKDGSKTVMLMNRLDRKDTGRQYDLTPAGFVDAGPIDHPLPTPPKVEKSK